MMLKKLLFALTLLGASVTYAGVEINDATAAELDGLKGIGPALSTKILEQRKNGQFKNWADLMARVKGVREPSAMRLSAQGLTVNGTQFVATPGDPKAQK